MWSLFKRFRAEPEKAVDPEPTREVVVAPPVAEPPPRRFTRRMGVSVEVDEVFDAWTSGDLERMIAALPLKTNLIDRHFLLMGIVDAAYKQREEPELAALCAKVSEMHLAEFPVIAPALKQDMGGRLPRVSTFQHYATLLAEDSRFDEAVAVCEQAISYGLRDGTVSGFEGRIKRIRKQQAAEGEEA